MKNIIYKFRGKPIMTDKQNLVYGWGCYTDENERFFIVIDKNQFIQVEKIDVFIDLLDKNGKEIYEGDILFDKINGHRHIIQRQENEARFIAKIVNSYGIRHIPDVKIMEIIGNKYENSELLK